MKTGLRARGSVDSGRGEERRKEYESREDEMTTRRLGRDHVIRHAGDAIVFLIGVYCLLPIRNIYGEINQGTK